MLTNPSDHPRINLDNTSVKYGDASNIIVGDSMGEPGQNPPYDGEDQGCQQQVRP